MTLQRYIAVSMIVLAVFGSFHLNTYKFDSFPQKVDELRQLSQVKGDVDQLQRQGLAVQSSYRGKTSVLFQAFISCMQVYKVGVGNTSASVAAENNNVFVVFHYDRFSLNRSYKRKPFRPIYGTLLKKEVKKMTTKTALWQAK